MLLPLITRIVKLIRCENFLSQINVYNYSVVSYDEHTHTHMHARTHAYFRWIELWNLNKTQYGNKVFTKRTTLTLSTLVKISADHINILCMPSKIFSRRHFVIFFFFSPENRIWNSCKWSSLQCMKCQILFSRKNKRNFINLASVEFVHSTVSVKCAVQAEQKGKSSIVCSDIPIRFSFHLLQCPVTIREKDKLLFPVKA